MYCFMFCFHLHPIPSHIARLPHFLGVFATWTLRITIVTIVTSSPECWRTMSCATHLPCHSPHSLRSCNTSIQVFMLHTSTHSQLLQSALKARGTVRHNLRQSPAKIRNPILTENGQTSWGRTNMLAPDMVNMVGQWWVDWRKNCLRWFDPDTCPWNVFKGLKTESQAKIERPTASFIIFTSVCLHQLTASVFLFLHRRPWTAKWSSSCHDRTCRLGARFKVERYKLH